MTARWLEDTVVAFVSVAAADASTLPPAELALLGASARPERRAHFIAGRAAAREALRRFGVDTSTLLIGRHEGDRRGRPVLRGPAAPSAVELSISHTSGWACAAVSRSPLGIDLVAQVPTAASFVDEAFAPAEHRAWIDAAGPADGPRLAFAAKEVALKWMGVGFGRPLRSVVTTPTDLGPPALTPHPRPFALQVVDRGEASTLRAWTWTHDDLCVLLGIGRPGVSGDEPRPE